MGRKRTPALALRGGIWHIDKRIRGGRLRESTGTSSLAEAEAYLVRRLEQVREARVYGVRPQRTFRQAATKYLMEGIKRSLARDAQDLRIVDSYIGHLALEQVHMGTLREFISARRAQGVKSATVNRTLAVVRRVLNLAARLWRDEQGMTWLQTAPMIELEDWEDKRPPYPLSWDEQRLLFRELPAHLAAMALFEVNTGTRDQEVCGLRWSWEEAVPALGISVFVIPGGSTKNKEERVVVLNRVARSVVDAQRGKHPVWVFPYTSDRVGRMYNTAWKRARHVAAERYEDQLDEICPAGFRNVRVHDLKHTFGRRLRAGGVPLETRRVLLGHKSGDITTHYSAPELEELLSAAELVCEEPAQERGWVLLRGSARGVSARKMPTVI